MVIPRLIHWWWDGPPCPPEYARFRDRWRELHPEWELMDWDGESFRLNFEHHPASALYFERDYWSPRAHEWGWKTNIARLLILRRYGGLWVDADLEPLKAVDPLVSALPEGGALVAREDRTHVNNAFFASPPGGRFVTALVEGLPDRVRTHRGKPSNVVTGPHYLTEVIARHPEVTVLDPALIYPMHWSELDRREDSFPAAYTLHHWHRKSTETRRSRPASTRSGPRITRSPSRRKEPVSMNVPRNILRVEGLTPANVVIALADLATQVPRAQAIVELGVYRGRTALALAWGARRGHGAKVWAVDPWDLPGERGPYTQNPAGVQGKHRQSFTDPGTRAWARYNVKALGFANFIRLIRGFSVEEGERWSGPPVGMLFVDGDHRYEAVRADLTAWARRLADNAIIAFDDYTPDTHPEVVQAVNDMVEEGILEPVQVFHDRLAVTKLGSGHPELVRREQVRAVEQAKITSMTSEGAAVEIQGEGSEWAGDPSDKIEGGTYAGFRIVDEVTQHQVLPDDLQIERGGIQFPLPPGAEEGWAAGQRPEVIEGDSTEHEHPGTGEDMEAVEATPDGTERTLTAEGIERVASASGVPEDLVTQGGPPVSEQAQKTWGAEVPPAEGRPTEPAGKGQTVPMASAPAGTDADSNVAVARETVLPGEVDVVITQTTVAELSGVQLRELAKARGIALGRGRRTDDWLRAVIRAGRAPE